MAQDPCPANGAWTRDDVPHRHTASTQVQKQEKSG
jgi:hypothetical protein